MYEITCVQAAPTTYVAAVSDGLVVYYNGTLSGNSLVDLSGNSNTGYATSVTQEANSKTGTSYIKLNGVNSKIDISNNVQTNISSPMSIEFYGSINSFTQYGALVSKHENWATDWYLTCSSTSPYNHGLGNGKRNIGLKSCGWDPTSPHYVMDLFQQYNLPYAWAYIDVPIDEDIGTSKINSVGLPVDIVWQNTNLALNNSTPLYQWKSGFSGKGSSLTYYTDDTIDDMYWMKANVPVALFDYNNNNIIDFDDVVTLYKIFKDG